jgi:hypothetical protein
MIKRPRAGQLCESTLVPVCSVILLHDDGVFCDKATMADMADAQSA